MSVFDEDLDIFFADDGESVTIDAATITALFDEPFEFGQQAQETYSPQITVKTADLAGIARPLQGKTVTRVGTGSTYTIITPINDGKGLTRIEMRDA